MATIGEGGGVDISRWKTIGPGQLKDREASVFPGAFRGAGEENSRYSSGGEFGDEGAQYYSGNGTTAYYIGPYQVSVNQGRSGSGRLKFDFAMTAKFTLTNGQIYEYGYDPEMDVEVSA